MESGARRRGSLVLERSRQSEQGEAGRESGEEEDGSRTTMEGWRREGGVSQGARGDGAHGEQVIEPHGRQRVACDSMSQ